MPSYHNSSISGTRGECSASIYPPQKTQNPEYYAYIRNIETRDTDTQTAYNNPYMNFILSITLAALNAIMAITCLVASGKHTKHPFGVYLAAAMLLWWPVMIYPILFASERKAAADPDRRAAARFKLRPAWATAACSVAMQALATAIIGFSGMATAADDTARICALAATFLMTSIMLTAIRLRANSTDA